MVQTSTPKPIRSIALAGAAGALLLVASACSSDATTATAETSAPTAAAAPATPAPTIAVPSTEPPTTTAEAPATEPPTTTAAGPVEDNLIRFSTSRTEAAVLRIPNGTPPPAPAGSEPFTVVFEGQTIRGIEIPGAEPAVVLLHGFPDNLHLYDELYPLLAGKRRVIAFDFIGWGTSDKPLPGEFTYTMESNERQIEAVMTDRLAGAPATLVLHDASGIPGLDLSLRRPEMVADVVLLNTFYGLAPTQSPPTAITMYSNPALQGVEDAINLDAKALEDLYRWQIAEFLQVPGEALVVDRLWSQFPEALPAFVALNDELFGSVAARTARSGELAGLQMPVSIVFGAKDINLTAEVGLNFASLIPGSKLTILEDAGHFVQIDRPDAVAAVLLGS
jgi:haloalkane dehalogenase